MDSLIEVQRQTHEEVERFERALYSILSHNYGSHEAKLSSEHKASQILDRVAARATSLSHLYSDEGARKAEIAALSAPNGNQDDLAEFYARLVKIQDHYHKYPDSAPGGGFDLELAAFLDEPEQELDEEDDYEDPVSLMFSGEEGYGKYLDLYANHTSYNNIKKITKRLGYLQYIDALLAAPSNSLHQELPLDVRLSKDYESYIKTLHTYLLSFTKRTQPLTNVEDQQKVAEEGFNTSWEAGNLSGWEAAPPSAEEKANGGAGIWCAACEKMYSKQTVYDAHLSSKKHIKATAKLASSESGAPANPNGPSAGMETGGSAMVSSSRDKHRVAALLSHLATALLANLVPALNDTKANVERRFSLTAREREQELLEQAKKPAPAPVKTDGAEGEEEPEERIYNPLKLPLGWDGKPIPYWLYKLHGLGVEYRCEICSDQVYMGRKNFERHFQETKHAFGMRALGLPNTKHFHEITKIQDALALADRLKKEGRHEIFEQETMEELEDDEGNVYNRKTYDDLKNQGLI